jgi:hypothetical protein
MFDLIKKIICLHCHFFFKMGRGEGTRNFTVAEDVAIMSQWKIHGNNCQQILENLQTHKHILLDLGEPAPHSQDSMYACRKTASNDVKTLIGTVIRQQSRTGSFLYGRRTANTTELSSL